MIKYWNGTIGTRNFNFKIKVINQNNILPQIEYVDYYVDAIKSKRILIPKKDAFVTGTIKNQSCGTFDPVTVTASFLNKADYPDLPIFDDVRTASLLIEFGADVIIDFGATLICEPSTE